jgi:hypothetical protein
MEMQYVRYTAMLERLPLWECKQDRWQSRMNPGLGPLVYY